MRKDDDAPEHQDMNDLAQDENLQILSLWAPPF
jgi:hypothetical protein